MNDASCNANVRRRPRGFRKASVLERFIVGHTLLRARVSGHLFCIVTVGGALTPLVGCQSPQPSLAGTPFDPDVPPKYVLQPGDKLLVRHASDTDLDQEVLVRTDGMISLPYVGDIPAALKSPAELTEELNKTYADVLARPDTTVMVLKESGRRIYIGGELRMPGTMLLHPNQTLIQAIFEGGGLTPEAYRKGVLVMRARPGGGVHVLRVDIGRVLAGDHPDVRLQPLDIIYVPETAIAKVDRFVEQYINRVVPRPFSFPFSLTYELHNQPIRVRNNQPGTAVGATR